MELSVIGVSHITAPLNIREQCAFTNSQIIEITASLQDSDIDEVIILSTCNRSELYFVSSGSRESIETVRNIFLKNIPEAAYEYIFEYTGKDAIYHLYSVAAGLESAVFGEDQILGQVRNAFDFARNLGATGKISSYLFRQGITTAKKIKSELKISQYPLSTIHIGLELIEERAGSLENKRILLVGMGKINSLALKYLEGKKPSKIFLCSRRCKELIGTGDYQNCTIIPFAERYNYIEQSDVIISATSAPHSIFFADQFPPLSHPVYFLDMAVPRDADKSVGLIPQVSLFNIDSLREISDKSLETRKALGDKAKNMINDAVMQSMDWLRLSITDNSIQNLNDRCRTITDDSMEIICRKIDLTPREQALIRKTIHSGLHRIIREPIKALKSSENQDNLEEYLEIINKIFQI